MSFTTQLSVIPRRTAWLFVDSLLPTQLAPWDVRPHIAITRHDYVLHKLKSRLNALTIHHFQVLSLEPYMKDGGIFVQFQYSAAEPQQALDEIQRALANDIEQRGRFVSWLGFGRGNGSMVKGSPWKEDLRRFASPTLRVTVDGPDLDEQSLYDLLRSYGPIADLEHASASASASRTHLVTYRNLHSATVARNVIHNLYLDKSHFRVHYQPRIQTHVLWTWLSSHPKVVLPVVLFALGTLTYAVFDPVRAFMVKSKLLNRFNHRDWKIYHWMQKNSYSNAILQMDPLPTDEPYAWKERDRAGEFLRGYVEDTPGSILFVHGPQGSGKTRLVESALSALRRKVLVIDCDSLEMANSEKQLIDALARQTGYWPVFALLSSVSSLLDVASLSLVGQKAGFSEPLPARLQQILRVVADGLRNYHTTIRERHIREIAKEQSIIEESRYNVRRAERIRQGLWHDGRLDCVAGNGIISELGFGDERLTMADSGLTSDGDAEGNSGSCGAPSLPINATDGGDIRSLPVVVIYNFHTKIKPDAGYLLEVLANWSAHLVSNKIAHVIIVSDNKENYKILSKNLPAKPVLTLALEDADPNTALAYLRRLLQGGPTNFNPTPNDMDLINSLGGRASELESLAHKIKNGQTIQEAVKEIISRSSSEVRQKAFGEAIQDGKTLGWTRQQIWTVIKLLAKRSEIPYHDLLLHYPFKGNEINLQNLENAELISITIKDGRPSTIRPGRPVYQAVFGQFMHDDVFRALEEIIYNEGIIKTAEVTVNSCEQELVTLQVIRGLEGRHWWGSKSATSMRVKQVLDKMKTATNEIETAKSEIKKLQEHMQRAGSK